MDYILDLLSEKVRYLEKLYNINENHLIHIRKGKGDSVGLLYAERESVISYLKRLNIMMGHSLDWIEEDKANSQMKSKIKGLLDYKSELSLAVLAQDLEMLSFVESETEDLTQQNEKEHHSNKVSVA